ncbi:MAG TPA: hypothetical protein VGQ93_05280 [Lysobacter sp.]|nr:hypothetical protein [Lysobacter sp.]
MPKAEHQTVNRAPLHHEFTGLGADRMPCFCWEPLNKAISLVLSLSKDERNQGDTDRKRSYF